MPRLLIVCALGLALSGCEAVHLQAEICGVYSLNMDRIEASLEIKSDHTYTEAISVAGKTMESNGKWKWDGDYPEFEGLVLPDVFFPLNFSTDEQALSVYHATRVGPFYKLNRRLFPLKFFGSVRLEINPDQNGSFKRIRN
jgi:hypothetical protein